MCLVCVCVCVRVHLSQSSPLNGAVSHMLDKSPVYTLWLKETHRHTHKHTLRDVTDGRPSSDLCIYCMSPRKIRHTHKSIPNTFLPFCCSNYHLWIPIMVRRSGVYVCLCVCTCVFLLMRILRCWKDTKNSLCFPIEIQESWLGFAHSHSSDPFTHVMRAQDRLVSFLTVVGGLQESTAELESNQKKSVRVLSLTLQQPSVMGLKLCCLSFITNSWKNGEKNVIFEIQPDRQHTSHQS